MLLERTLHKNAQKILRVAVQEAFPPDKLNTTGDRFRAHKRDGAACPLPPRLGARSCAIATRGRRSTWCRARCARTVRSYASGAPLQEQMHMLRMKKASFVRTRLTKQTVTCRLPFLQGVGIGQGNRQSFCDVSFPLCRYVFLSR